MLETNLAHIGACLTLKDDRCFFALSHTVGEIARYPIPAPLVGDGITSSLPSTTVIDVTPIPTLERHSLGTESNRDSTIVDNARKNLPARINCPFYTVCLNELAIFQWHLSIYGCHVAGYVINN